MESLSYLFGALFLFAGFGFGIAGFVWGCRNHSRNAKWLAGFVFLFSTLGAVAVYFEVIFERRLDLNPWINDDAEIAGTWTDNLVMLTLGTNHTFNYQDSERTFSGTWTRDDFNLYLKGSVSGGTLRFVQFQGEYRLMTHRLEGMPKMWDDLGLRRN
jgi:hypothetical protein